MASSRSALLAALEGCIKSLHNAGFLHRDISINNLMINGDDNNPSWQSFLMDVDLAIREQREGTSGAQKQDRHEGIYGNRDAYGRTAFLHA